jgi:hypothetical protein
MEERRTLRPMDLSACPSAQIRIEMLEQTGRVPIVIRVRGGTKPVDVDLYLRWHQTHNRIKVTPGDTVAPK